MFEATILIPVTDNKGNDFTDDHHDLFAVRAGKLFGGVTRMPELAKGVWVEAGKTYRDEMLMYVVSLHSIGQGADLVKLVRWAMRHYRQLAMYVRYLGQSEIIKRE